MRLIDADRLTEEIDEWLNSTGVIPIGTSYYGELMGCVEDTPTIEATPVKHAKWNLYGNDDDTGMSYWCSNCRFNLSEDLFYSGYKNGEWVENNVFKFCPNCGARMDEE